MNDETALRIFGTKELASLFDEMSTDVKKNIVNTGFRKAGRIIIDKASENLNGVVKDPGKFRKSLGTKPDPAKMEMEVGMRRKGVGWKAHFFEGGTVDRYYKKKSYKIGPVNFKKTLGAPHFTGKIKASHFFENAVESTREEVTGSIFQFIKESFEKLIRKYEGKKKA